VGKVSHLVLQDNGRASYTWPLERVVTILPKISSGPYVANVAITKERIMNKDQLAGGLKIMRGRLNAQLAVLFHSPELQRRAQQLQLDGKVQHTMGEARELIRRSLKQHLSA
jgi:hypothetical protein